MVIATESLPDHPVAEDSGVLPCLWRREVRMSEHHPMLLQVHQSTADTKPGTQRGTCLQHQHHTQHLYHHHLASREHCTIYKSSCMIRITLLTGKTLCPTERHTAICILRRYLNTLFIVFSVKDVLGGHATGYVQAEMCLQSSINKQTLYFAEIDKHTYCNYQTIKNTFAKRKPNIKICCILPKI